MRVIVNGALRSPVAPKDVILAVIAKIGASGGPGTRSSSPGDDPEDVDGGADDGVQHDDRGGGPLRLIAPDEITFAYLKGRPLGLLLPVDAAVADWKTLPSDPDAAWKGRGRSTCPISSRTSPGVRARRTPSVGGSVRTRRRSLTLRSGRVCGGRSSTWGLSRERG